MIRIRVVERHPGVTIEKEVEADFMPDCDVLHELLEAVIEAGWTQGDDPDDDDPLGIEAKGCG